MVWIPLMLSRSTLLYSLFVLLICTMLAVVRRTDFPDYWMITQDEANRHLSVTTPEGVRQWEIEPAYVNPTLVYYLRGHLLYIENNGTVLWRTRVDGKRRRKLFEDATFFPYYSTATEDYRVFVYRTISNDYRAVITNGTQTNDFYSPNLIFTPALWSGNQRTLYVETAVDQQFIGNIVAIDVTTGDGDYLTPGSVSNGLARGDRFIYQWQRQWRLSDGSELPFEPDTVMLDWLDDESLLIGFQSANTWELYRATLDGSERTKLIETGLPPLARHNDWLYAHTTDQSLVRINLQTSEVESLLERVVIFEEARDYTPIDPLLIYTDIFFVQNERWIITTMQDGDAFYLVRLNPDGSDLKILHTHHESDTVRLYLSADEQWLIVDSLYAEDIFRINISSGKTQQLPVETFLFTIPTFEGNWHGWEFGGGALITGLTLLAWRRARSTAKLVGEIA